MDKDFYYDGGTFFDHNDFERNDYDWPDEDDYSFQEKEEVIEPWWSFYIEDK